MAWTQFPSGYWFNDELGVAISNEQYQAQFGPNATQASTLPPPGLTGVHVAPGAGDMSYVDQYGTQVTSGAPNMNLATLYQQARQFQLAEPEGDYAWGNTNWGSPSPGIPQNPVVAPPTVRPTGDALGELSNRDIVQTAAIMMGGLGGITGAFGGAAAAPDASGIVGAYGGMDAGALAGMDLGAGSAAAGTTGLGTTGAFGSEGASMFEGMDFGGFDPGGEGMYQWMDPQQGGAMDMGIGGSGQGYQSPSWLEQFMGGIQNNPLGTAQQLAGPLMRLFGGGQQAGVGGAGQGSYQFPYANVIGSLLGYRAARDQQQTMRDLMQMSINSDQWRGQQGRYNEPLYQAATQGIGNTAYGQSIAQQTAATDAAKGYNMSGNMLHDIAQGLNSGTMNYINAVGPLAMGRQPDTRNLGTLGMGLSGAIGTQANALGSGIESVISGQQPTLWNQLASIQSGQGPMSNQNLFGLFGNNNNTGNNSGYTVL